MSRFLGWVFIAGAALTVYGYYASDQQVFEIGLVVIVVVIGVKLLMSVLKLIIRLAIAVAIVLAIGTIFGWDTLQLPT